MVNFEELLAFRFSMGLKGVEKVAVEHFSIAFKGHQPKSQTLEIVDKIDFPEDHPFLNILIHAKSIWRNRS